MEMLRVAQRTTIPALQEVLAFTEARHNILAGNIANMDTPGYKIRDLNVGQFHEQLQVSIEERKSARTAAETRSPGLVDRQLEESPEDRVQNSLEHILYHDQRNISVEHQVAELSKNQYMHNMAIAIMNSQFRLLQTAISERV